MKSRLMTGVAALSMLFAVGCTDENLVENSSLQGEGNFTIEVGLGVDSRACYEHNGEEYVIKWQESDKIYVSSEDGKVFGTLKLIEGKGTTSGKFSGMVIGDKKKLNYVVYPVPNKSTKKIDLTTRDAAFHNPPMIATLGDDKTKADLEAPCPAILLNIKGLTDETNTLVVEGDGIGGKGTVIKEDGEYDLSFEEDSQDKITITGISSTTEQLFIPIVAGTDIDDASVIAKVTLKLSVGGAEYEKAVRFNTNRVTDSPANGFLQLTYIPATESNDAQLIEAWNSDADESWYNESETEFVINKASELAGLANLVESGVTFEGKTVKLGQCIDLANKLWNPIGTFSNKDSEQKYFRGVFDGQGNSVDNLYINGEYAGLFECVWGATIKNLTIQNAEMVGENYAGAVVACVRANADGSKAVTTIENVIVEDSEINGEDNSPLFGFINSFGIVNVVEGDKTTQYTSNSKLNELLAAGGVVTLDKNVVCNTNDPLIIPEGVTVTLNLNGYTIENGKGRDGNNNRVHVLKNFGNAEIVNGTVVSRGENGGSAIYNAAGATLTIENVKVLGAPKADGSWPSYAINNYGDLTVKSATVKSYHGGIATGENGVTVINDATVDVGQSTKTGITSYTLYTESAAKLTVNGGTFANTATDAGSTGGAIACEGGDNAIEINGGNFSGGCGLYGSYVIKGGTFDRDVESHVAEGYKVEQIYSNYYVMADDVAYAVNDQMVKNAVNNASISTIMLNEGEFNINLYDNDKKESLTIIGQEGTKIEFSNLQVRPSQFKSLTIKNCEILRMPDKKWGHCVFSSSENAEGVYTLENCTFDGEGSQGIYINENKSGATYNIINCIFNGNFGDEGAVTIQNNNDVEHIVNVKGCKFNNIPETSHKIYVHYAYDGWTLNTDMDGNDIYWKEGKNE